MQAHSKNPGFSRTPLPRIKWYESWITRLAAIAAIILFVGYASSAYVAFQSIGSISELAHDEEIEHSLVQHLDDLKRIHNLHQRLIEERLRQVIVKQEKTSQTWPDILPDEARIRTWLKQAGIDEITSIKDVVISFPKDLKSEKIPLRWRDRDRLQLYQAVILFPKSPVYAEFKAADEVRKRYQLVGAKLHENIRPTLIRALSLILIVSFCLLLSIVVFYTRSFKRRLGEVLQGFSTWSEADDSFRFQTEKHADRPSYTGELRLITTQFNSMADEVEANRQRNLFLEKIASWQIIARKLAHEIKNPLTPIQMMVSQLKRRYKGDDAEFAKLLDNAQTIITEEVGSLRRMVDNFSNFARLPEPELKPTNLLPLCQHVVELQKNVFPQHELKYASSVAQPMASIDEDLIRQVLINLIKNAGEACGEHSAHITLNLSENAQNYMITVHDDGPGIPAENLERIFEAYFTTKHTGPSPGMGLGLAVCQKIILDHGGKMQVSSRPGDTRFIIQLPKRPPN